MQNLSTPAVAGPSVADAGVALGKAAAPGHSRQGDHRYPERFLTGRDRPATILES